MPRPQGCKDVCKRCDGKFGIDIDPTDKEGKELLKRRVPGAATCKPCWYFASGHEDYASMKDSALGDLEGPRRESQVHGEEG